MFTLLDNNNAMFVCAGDSLAVLRAVPVLVPQPRVVAGAVSADAQLRALQHAHIHIVSFFLSFSMDRETNILSVQNY